MMVCSGSLQRDSPNMRVGALSCQKAGKIGIINLPLTLGTKPSVAANYCRWNSKKRLFLVSQDCPQSEDRNIRLPKVLIGSNGLPRVQV